MRAISTTLVLVLLVASARNQDAPARPDTPEQAADKVLAALKAEDQKALKALAEEDDPDPWLVADELLVRGEQESALAFARSAPRPERAPRLPMARTS